MNVRMGIAKKGWVIGKYANIYSSLSHIAITLVR